MTTFDIIVSVASVVAAGISIAWMRHLTIHAGRDRPHDPERLCQFNANAPCNRDSVREDSWPAVRLFCRSLLSFLAVPVLSVRSTWAGSAAEADRAIAPVHCECDLRTGWPIGKEAGCSRPAPAM